MKKIIDEIMLAAKTEAQNIIAEAENDAEKIITSAQKECDKILNGAEIHRKTELERLKKRYVSSRASKRRNRLLQVKREIMEECINNAFSDITSADDEEYEKIILKLLLKGMRRGSGILYFPKDYSISKKLEESIKKLAKEKGCSYTISRERSDVKDGFVLVYGGIEENCTFNALFEEKKAELSEQAAKILLGMGDSV